MPKVAIEVQHGRQDPKARTTTERRGGAAGSSSSKKPNDIFGHCNEKVNDKGANSEGLLCDCCMNWVHAGCEGITTSEYKKIQKVVSKITYYCSARNCNDVTSRVLKGLAPLEDQVKTNTGKISDLEEKLARRDNEMAWRDTEIAQLKEQCTKIEEKCSRIEEKIEETVNSKMTSPKQ